MASMAMLNKQRVSGKQQTLSCDRGFGQIAIGGRVREFKSAIAHGSADYLVGGLEHFFLHRTRIPTDEHIFRGVEATNQLYYIYIWVCVYMVILWMNTY